MNRSKKRMRVHMQMRQILFCTIIFALLIPSFPVHTAVAEEGVQFVQFAGKVNLIANPGFEEVGTSGNFPGWNIWAPDGQMTTNMYYNDAAEGQKSASLITTGAVTAQLSQRIAVESGRTYLFSYWAKSAGMASSGFAGSRLQFYNTGGGKTADNVHIGNAVGTTEWSRFVERVTMPEGTTRLEINALVYRTQGEAWFDGFELYELQDAPPNLLQNPGFEQPAASGAIPSWTLWAPDGHVQVSVSEEAREGQQAAQFVTEEVVTAQLHQKVAVQPGKRYALQYWAKTDEMQKSYTAGVRLQFYNANGGKTADNMQVGNAAGVTNWTRFGTEFTVPAGTTTLEVDLLLYRSKGHAWFDQMLLYELDSDFERTILSADALVLADGVVQLEWVPVEPKAVATYEVYRFVQSGLALSNKQLLGTTNKTVFLDQSVQAGRSYVYKIVQTNISDDAGLSDGIGVQIPAVLPGVKSVDTLSATESISGEIILNWTIRPENRAAAVVIYGANDPITEENLTEAVVIDPASAALDSMLVIDVDEHPTWKKHYYAVEVYDGDGNRSNVVSSPITSFLPKLEGEWDKQHPYLFANQQEIDAVIQNIGNYPWMERVRDMIIANADTVLLAYGGLIEMYGPDHAQHSQIAESARVLSIAYALTGDERYAAAAGQILQLYVSYYENYDFVYNQHKDDGGLVFPLAWAYDFIYNSEALSAADKLAIENGYFREIAARLQTVSRGRLENQGDTNWALGVIGFLLKDQPLLDIAFERPGYGLKYNMLNGISDDGYWWEQTINYHQARINSFALLAEAAYHSGYDLYGYELDGKRDVNYKGSDPFPVMEGRIIDVQGKNIKELYDASFYLMYPNMSYAPFADAEAQVLTSNYAMESAYRRYGDPKFGALAASTMGMNRTSGLLEDYFSIFAAQPALPDSSFSIGNGIFGKKGINKLGSSLFLDSGFAMLRSPGAASDSTNIAMQWNPFGSTTHSHGDKLSFAMYGASGDVIVDPGRYAYGSVGQKEFAKHTIAHNTVVVDEKSQYPYTDSTNEWQKDSAGRSSAGYLSAVSVGTSARMLQAGNDQVYVDFGVGLERTIAQIDDYMIDVFRAHGTMPHQYDYPLTVAGTLKDSSVALVSQNPNLSLGASNGYQHIKHISRGMTATMWQTDWNLGAGKGLRMTMLPQTGTEVIKARGLSRTGEMNNEMLIARRADVNSTMFVNVLEPYWGEAGSRAITAVPVNHASVSPEESVAVQIATVEGTTVDLFLTGPADIEKQAGALTSDGRTTLYRQQDGHDNTLAIMKGKQATGSEWSIQMTEKATAQLTKVADCAHAYRFDYDGEQSTQIDLTMTGLEAGLSVYRMALADENQFETEASANISGNNVSFVAEPGSIYMIALPTELANIPAPAQLIIMNQQPEPSTQGRLALLENPLSGLLIEAEDFEREINGKINIANFGGASHSTNHPAGNAIYGWDNKGHTLEWEINLPEAGDYEVMLRYATMRFNATRLFQVDEGEKYQFYFPPTTGWSVWANAQLLDWQHEPLRLSLEAGKHTIRMENESGALNLDQIIFVPVYKESP